jgi:hypothetical protein
MNVRSAHGSHHGAVQTRVAYSLDGLQRAVKRARLAYGIVSLSQSVNAQLILAAAQRLQSSARLGCQVKRIAHNGKWNTLPVQHFEYIPEAGMQNRVAAGDVEIWQTLHALTHLAAAVNHSQATLHAHLYQLGVSLAEDVAVLATLVAHIRDVPLKGKVFHLLQVFLLLLLP